MGRLDNDILPECLRSRFVYRIVIPPALCRMAAKYILHPHKRSKRRESANSIACIADSPRWHE